MENIKEIDIVITLIAGTLVMILMAVVIVYAIIKYQQRVLKQKEELRLAEKKFQMGLLEASIFASENERIKIAKNVHDDVGGLLNAIKLSNARLKKNIKNEPLSLELSGNINKMLNDLIETVSSINNDLASPTLLKLGFIKALNQFASQVSVADKLKITIKMNEFKLNAPVEVEMQLLRICKEIITNIFKHNTCTNIVIQINYNLDLLDIIINYNGTGINDEEAKQLMQNSKGLGLKSIYGRIQVLNGKISYLKMGEEYAKVLLQIPIKIQTH